jgi:hypothetical protein
VVGHGYVCLFRHLSSFLFDSTTKLKRILKKGRGIMIDFPAGFKEGVNEKENLPN